MIVRVQHDHGDDYRKSMRLDDGQENIPEIFTRDHKAEAF